MKTIKEMTMFVLLPEIFEKFAAANTDEELKTLIVKHNTPAMRKILSYVLWPNFKFFVDHIPEYKPDPAPKGHNPTSLWDKINVFYLFDPANNTPVSKKETILRQVCECIHPSEAEFINKILKRDLGIPRLTYRLVSEAILGLLPRLDENGEMGCQFQREIEYVGKKIKICGKNPPCDVCLKKMVAGRV